MIIENILKLINNKKYSFLLTEKLLKDKIILLTLGGSYSYGLNTETSDVDCRGICLEQPEHIIGYNKHFEQFLNDETDTCIYAFNKIINLLAGANPNVLELLGITNREEQYFTISDNKVVQGIHPIGKLLIDNRKMFLSKIVSHTFLGYSNAQLRRITNALARDRVEQPLKEQHILNSINHMRYSMEQNYTDFTLKEISLEIDNSDKADLEKEIFINLDLKHYPLRDLRAIINDFHNTVKGYENFNARNTKRDDKALNKHASHLVRLYNTGIEILEKEDIYTYRTTDRDLLMDIKQGKYMKSDGTYDEAFYDLINELEKKFKYAEENTCLPNKPDYKKINEFVMDINRIIINS